MYMGWIKPYLKNITRLSTSEKHTLSPDIISAFETSMMEIEILAIKQKVSGHHPCILANFEYTTKPTLSYQQEYQRGPIHVGCTRITYRAYAWTKEQIEAYKKMRDEEDFELLGLVDRSVKAAMEALGEELEKYLEEAGETFEKKEVKETNKVKQEGLFAPFTYIFKNPAKKPVKKKKKVDPYKLKKEIKAAIKEVKSTMWLSYKNFKKAHRMLAW